MFDVWTDEIKFDAINHQGKEGQQVIFKDKNGNKISVLLNLNEFESLYHACIGRAETLESFEPWKNGWYKLKQNDSRKEVAK